MEFLHKKLQKRQRVKNSLALIMLMVSRLSSAERQPEPLLMSLHWLQLAKCIPVKVATLIHRELTTHQPPYLSDPLQHIMSFQTKWSIDMKLLTIPDLCLETVRRMFHLPHLPSGIHCLSHLEIDHHPSVLRQDLGLFCLLRL